MKKVLQTWDDGNNSSLMKEITVTQYGIEVFMRCNPNDTDERFRYKANYIKLTYKEVAIINQLIKEFKK